MTNLGTHAPPSGAVAYQGGAGAFSEQAARLLVGPDALLAPCRTFAEVFDSLRTGRVRAAVPVSYTHLTLPTICSV